MTEPTVTFRVDAANPGHVHLTVFIGRNPGARGHSGTLTLRTDELAELLSPAEVERIVGSAHLVLRGAVKIDDPDHLATIRTAVEEINR